MCFLDLLQGMEGGWGPLKLHELFLGIFAGRVKYEKTGWPSKWKIIYKSVKALIPLKEGHQDLLKLHIPLKRCSSVDEKNGAPKGNFVWSGKKICEEACQDLLKYCVSCGGGLKLFNEKVGRQQKGEVLLWNLGKPHLKGNLWKSRGTLHVWWSYRNCWMHQVNI